MIWTRLWSRKSSLDKGSLFQVIHRTSVPNNPQDNMNAAEDFLTTVLDGYVVAAATHIMNSIGQSVNEQPISRSQLAKKIVDKYVCLSPLQSNARCG